MSGKYLQGADIYRRMRDDGATPREVCKRAQQDGVPLIRGLKMLREVFGLSLAQAKEVWLQADGLATSLLEYQEQLFPVLQGALDEAESEEK